MAIDFKITLPITIAKAIAVKTILWLRRSHTPNQGKLPLAFVSSQGEIPSCIHSYVKDKQVKDLPEVFRTILIDNVNPKYRKNGALPEKEDKIPNEEKIKFIINHTRISTYFIFTDGKRVIFHDKEKTSNDLQRVENNRFDFFGAVTFENSTLPLVLGNESFLKSKIQDTSCIPGFAFEETIEPEDNLLGKQTVIMIGFEFLLTPTNLSKAKSSKTSIIEIRDIDNPPDSDNLTSKATHGMAYLQSKYISA